MSSFYYFKLSGHIFNTLDEAVQYYCNHESMSDCHDCPLRKKVKIITEDDKKEHDCSLCGDDGITQYPELICIYTGIEKEYKPIEEWTVREIIEWENQKDCRNMNCNECPIRTICREFPENWKKAIQNLKE